MIILGIIGFGMNPAACLLRDGKCVAFAEEERFTRIKISEGLFPANAIRYCLSVANISLSSVDHIAFGWDVHKYPFTIGRHFLTTYLKYKTKEMNSFHKEKENASILLGLEGLTDFHPSRIMPKIKEGFRSIGWKKNISKIEFVSHHLAHAYSAYFCSNFQKAGILTIDGHGEELCTQLSIGENNTIRAVETFPIPHSLGWFYAAITEYLGFLPYRDEGKVMGLAAYGEASKKNNKWVEPLSKVLKITDNDYEVNPTFTLFGGHYYGKRYTDALVKLLTDIDPLAEPILPGEKCFLNGNVQNKYLLQHYIDIAWAAQELLERAAVKLGKRLINDYGVKNLCIAGGVGLNCKMNGEILRQTGCENIFIQPASNDAGSALGAALYVAHAYGEDVHQPLKNAYCGPEYSNDEINTVLMSCGARFKKVNDPSQEAARFLEEGKVIGWFQGRMECGPRALGNRSILANPIFPGIKDRVNKDIKFREMWRPFCPSLIEEIKNDYILNVKEASLMTVAYPMKESARKELAAIVHIDGTIRPQTVNKETNPLYHSLIARLGKKTNHSVVLNTSFNVKGEPIICNPREALRSFYSNGLDALIMGDFIINK